MIPNSLSDETGQDSEPVLAVHADQQLMVGAAYAFLNDKKPTKPLYVSTDRGNSWTLNQIIPATNLEFTAGQATRMDAIRRKYRT